MSTNTGNLNSVISRAPGGLNWWVFLWAAVIFITYGSLFPFNFLSDPKPLAEFYAQWHMLRNAADAVDNFMLFIPLGIGLDACFRTRSAKLAAGFVALLLLGIGIQLLQLYLPSRTSSVADVLWNTIGLSVGMLAFSRIRLAAESLLQVNMGRHDNYAMLLVAIWLCYESFPFVPTLDVGLLRDHVKTVIFAPPFETMRLLQHTLAAALAGVAIVRANWLRPGWLNVVILGGLAVFLEIFVAYGSLRRETLLGIAIGLFLGHWFDKDANKRTGVVVVLIALTAFLITVLTPYRGQPADSTFTWTPFSYLFWWGNTKDISPTAFEALVIGSLFWAGTFMKSSVSQPSPLWLGGVFFLLLMLELFRIYLMGYHGDTTPLFLALVLVSFIVSFGRRSPTRTHDTTNLLNPFALPLFGQSGKPQLSPGNLRQSPQSGAVDINPARDACTSLLRPRAEKDPFSRWIYFLYIIAVFCFIIYIIITGNAKGIRIEWLTYWLIGLSLLFFTIEHPIIGVVTYIIIGYGISSNGPEYDISLSLRLRDGIALLAFAAWIIEKRKSGESFKLWKLIPITASSYFLWLMLSISIAWIKGTPWGPILRFDPVTYIHAAIMFVLIADLLRKKSYHVGLALLIICTALGRAILQGLDGVYLESYVATLLVMSLPIAGIGILILKKIYLRIGYGIIAVAMLFFLIATQNRNAAVALLALVLVFILQLRLMWIKKIFILSVTAGIIALAMPNQYYDRFSSLWDPHVNQSTSGLDRATAEGRLALWRSAWEIAKDYPIFGAGPGNFAYFLKFYSPGQSRLGAHNSYLQALAETGFIGLFLYLALFLSAYLLLIRIRQNRNATWQADIASMLQLSLVAYLALGLFNNRNDLVLAYIIAGWAVALKFSLPAPATGSTSRESASAPKAQPIAHLT
ncbi:MAG: O-antigen ligase family protein [Rhodoferax sp.]|uniref:O-antigen ligase family protein n=1 Tax=Rhodoferax sp. TaxID=50421 RepID=UPI002613C7D2|nr:O-antigen ligase family protein [Rhodoferax sp.]MDD2881487.1 O-antigen ligase family protein [Rhodoferax sp.]